MNATPSHPLVRHPRELTAKASGWNDRVLDFFTDHILASKVMFNIALIVPLLAIPASTGVKVTLGVISGSWLQWWALHALQRRQNVTDAKRDAKNDTDHLALSHIALTVDAIHQAAVAEKQHLAEEIAALADATRAVLIARTVPREDRVAAAKTEAPKLADPKDRK